MKKRIAIILLGLILGILGFIAYENINILLVGLVFGALGIIFYGKNKTYTIFFLAILCGFTMANLKFHKINPKENKNVNIRFTILDKKKSKNAFRYTIKIDQSKEKAFMFNEGDFDIGERLECKGDLKAVRRNTNPNLFSYRFYAISKGIGLEFKPEKLNPEITRLRSRNIFLSLRRNFYSYINRIFRGNLSKEASDFVISLVLADNLYEKENINMLGLAHILAISGFHFDLLMTFMVFILSKIGFSYKQTRVITLCLGLLYGYIIGFAYSILRVLIVSTIIFLGFLLRRGVDKVKALMVAAILILFINPFAILNTGYVLSFMTMLAIYKIYPRLKAFFKEGFLRDNLAFTTSIQFAVLPFSVYYFRFFNFLSILANFFVVPIFEIAMYLIFSLIFLYPILRNFLRLGFIILDILIRSIISITEVLAKIKIFSLNFVAESIFVSLFLFALVFVLANIKNKKGLGKFLKTALAIVLISLGIRSLDRPIEYQMIDIGQGDAFLLNDRGKYYMVDVGGPKYKDYDSGKSILVPYLKSLGIREIEAAFISHEDSDHAGNLDILRENIRIKKIITDNKVSKEFKDKFKPVFMKKGDNFKLSHGLITCVYDGTVGVTEKNDQSLGLLINIRGNTILTMGDLSSPYEDKLKVKADILKLSHHGSAHSSSKDFIKKVDPKMVLISAGRDNTYGHPSKEALENVGDITKYNTQTDGLVKIKFYKGRVRVEKYLKGGFFR